MDTVAYAHFPRELNRNIAGELDRRFWIIFLAVFVLYFVLIFYVKSLPVPEVDTRKVLEYLYPTAVLPPSEVMVTSISVMQDSIALVEEKATKDSIAQLVSERIGSREELTPEQKRQKISEMKSRNVQMAQDISQNVTRMSVFQAIGTYKGPQAGVGYGSGTGRSIPGVTGGRKGISGQAGSLSQGGGSIRGGLYVKGAGEIIFTPSGESEMIQTYFGGGLQFERATVGEEGVGEASLRSQESIFAVVQDKISSLKRCFEKQKKRDPQLNGRILISMIILPDGIVEQVSIQSRWSNPTYGAEVDDCIRKRVSRWRFDRIEGDEVPVEIPISFY